MSNITYWLKLHPALYRLVKSFIAWCNAFGFIPLRFFNASISFPSVCLDFYRLRSANKLQTRPWNLQFSCPCFEDKRNSSGVASGHYFHQDLLIAQKIFTRTPKRHIDVGSRIDGFVAHVASYRQIEVLDLRQQIARVPNITFKQCDVMKPNHEFIECSDSVSCLHALEHFGLGRYGDALDINGHVVGIRNLCAMVEIRGILYLSVPIGKERVEFNGNRIFSISTIIDLVGSCFRLISFSYVDDVGDLHCDVDLNGEVLQTHLDLHYGCGIFEFEKMS